MVGEEVVSHGHSGIGDGLHLLQPDGGAGRAGGAGGHRNTEVPSHTLALPGNILECSSVHCRVLCHKALAFQDVVCSVHYTIPQTFKYEEWTQL